MKLTMNLPAFWPGDASLSFGRVASARSPAFWTAAAVLAAVMLTLGMAALGTTSGHSGGINLSWFAQYRDVLLGGALPRHLPQMWAGLGGLDFFFYGHVPYFTASLVSLACGDCADSTVFAAGSGIGYGLSLLTFHAFARRFVGPAAALAGALVYALLPYHLGVDWIWRQAAAEAFSYAFMPLVARGIDIALRDRRSASSLAIAVALQLATHLPTAVLAVHVFGATVIVWMLAVRRPARIAGALARLTGLSAVGAMLAAPFWLPAVTLLGDVAPEILFSDYFVASKWLVSLPVFQPPDRVVMILILAGFALSATVALAGARIAWRAIPSARLWVAVHFLVSAVLMTALSRPLWEVGLLPKVQFPWRLMVFVDLSGALGAALVAERLFARRRAAVLGAVIGAAVAFNAATLIVRDHVTAAAAPGGGVRIGLVEYVPTRFLEALKPLLPPGEPLFRLAAVLKDRAPDIVAGGDVRVIARLPRRTVVQPAAAGQRVAHVPVPWWPYWTAHDAEGGLEIRPDAAGLMEIAAVPARPLAGTIVIDLPWLRVEKAAALIALAGLLAFAALTFGAFTRPRHATPAAGSPRR